MIDQLKTSLGRFRAISFWEGVSFLVLMGIAMPLKYYMGFPIVVKIVGWAHGLLFIAYLFALLQVAMEEKWSLLKAVIAFIASLIPFGPFLFEARLRKEEKSVKASA